VALWGVGFYVTVLVVAIAGTLPRYSDSRGLGTLLFVLGTTGVLVSGYLTALELFVIHAICMWCVISAIIATLIFVLCWLERAQARRTLGAFDRAGAGL
jgi:uncharacterized membrane protein